MNLTIPLLGGVPFYGGESAFHFLMVTLRLWESYINKILLNEIATSPNQKTVSLLAIKLCYNPFLQQE
jgi:hypothetical protein